MAQSIPHKELRRLISASRHMVAFTGAGISAESGIPTYRGDDGLWGKYDPAKFASIDHFNKNPAYYWRFFKDVRYPVMRRARPNDAHFALATLEQQGVLKAVITQNIDGLQQAAGSRQVLELHGNTRRIVCLECGRQSAMEDVYQRLETQLPPLCPDCNGRLKPDVVFFGESLPAGVLENAVAEAQRCDLFLVVGSSLVVQPAAALPVMARRQGAAVVIVNRDPTPLDSVAELVFHSSASDVLTNL